MWGYRLKIELKEENKEVYRVIEVPSKLVFKSLHYIILEIFGLDVYDDYVFDLDMDSNDDMLELYLYNGMVFEYRYGENYKWNFRISVTQIDSSNGTPILIDHVGDSIEHEFDLDMVNSVLEAFFVADVINNNEIKYNYLNTLNEISSILEQREIKNVLKLKIVDGIAIYWVIIKTTDGYVIELFDDYNELVEGFYNLVAGDVSRVFGRFYTFILANKSNMMRYSLDEDGKISAFYNEPGYMPSMIEVEIGKEILMWLNDLLIALKNDKSTCNDEEMIEIYLNGGNYISSEVLPYETISLQEDYDNTYRGKEKLNNFRHLDTTVGADIIALPSGDTYLTGELQLYAIVASNSDYILKEIFLPDKKLMIETLIDGLIEFCNRYGIPDKITVNNLNIYFMIYDFLAENGIEINNGNIDLQISYAVIDAFGLGEGISELFDEASLQEIEDESEELLEEIDNLLDKKELLN